MTMMAVASVAAPVVGGLVGNIMGAKDRKRAQKMVAEAIKELQSVGLPPDLSKEIIYQQFQSAGILTPQLEQDIQVAESSVSKLKEDEGLRSAQKEALNIFRQQGKTGFGPEERAAFNQLRQANQQDIEAKRQQILADARRTGMAGSGASLVAQLQAAQAGADRASSEGDRLAAMMAERIRSSASGMADVASSVRGQDFQAEMARRQAEDARNMFLAQNSIARQRANIDRLNQAQQMNLVEQQRIMDANTQLANAEKLRQVQAQRDYWQDRLGYSQALANARLGQASQYQSRAAETAGMFQGIGSAIGGGINAYANMQNQNRMMSLLEKQYGAQQQQKP
jgi:hypothetical protein